MNSRPIELRFPKPTFRIDWSLVDSPPTDQVVSSYVEKIRSWRMAMLQFLQDSVAQDAPDSNGLSERSKWWLDKFLASSWPEDMMQWGLGSPYNLSPFPAKALEGASRSTVESVLEILRWRAGVTDCLDDIWDVVGEPLLDIDECEAIDQFLRPASEEPMCPFCLTEFASDKLNVSNHDCSLLGHVRAKWPPMPPKFERWKIQATHQSQVDADEQRLTTRKKWWQLWQ